MKRPLSFFIALLRCPVPARRRRAAGKRGRPLRGPVGFALRQATAALAVAAALSAATLPELFGRVKQRVSAGDWAGGLEALKELDAEAARPENEPARGALRPAAAFYRGVCFAAMGEVEEARGQFAVYIVANPDKGIDRKAYPKRVVAAFDEARRATHADASEETSSLGVAYRQTPYQSSFSPPPSPEWAQGPVKHLLTPEETRSFLRVAGDTERAEFVARFWLQRDPTPESPENEFRREFERRAAFADEHFSEGSTRGSLTDRGMVFVLLGPPSGVLRRPITVAEDTPAMLPMTTSRNPPPPAPVNRSSSSYQLSNWKEIWRYRRELLPPDVPYQQVDFAFVSRIDYGTNMLQRDGPSLKALDAARPKPHP